MNLQAPVKNHLWLGGILLLALFLRLIGVGDLSFWVDEYVHVIRARDVIQGNGPLFNEDNNGILLTFFIIPLFKFFGMNEWTARLPSVLFGTASVGMVYLIGKRLFNKPTALIAALLSGCSLYLIYWSRLARNYAIFEFFFLLCLLLFLIYFKPQKLDTKKKRNLALVSLPITFILSLISHQLSFFFILSAGLYFLLKGISSFWTKNAENKNLFRVLGGISALGFAVMFIPAFGRLMQNSMQLILPERIVKWVIPNWERLSSLMAEKPLEAFNVYKDVILYDYSYAWIIALGGLVWTFIKKPQTGVLLLCFLIFPFLLMSFIFREPSLPRYLIYLYPLYLLPIAFALTEGSKLLLFKLPKVKKWSPALAVLLFLPFIRGSEIKKLVQVVQKDNFIVDSKLSKWSFVNWKDPAEYLKPLLQEGDVILATVPKAAAWYLDKPETEIIWFRQKEYDTEKKGYVDYKELPEKQHAYSPEGFRNILNTQKRGWFLADYYLDNVLTHPQAKTLVYQNLHYEKEASPDGSVRLFHWDHSQGWEKDQQMVVVLGKSPARHFSKEYKIPLKKEMLQKTQTEFFFVTQGIDSAREAYFFINKKGKAYIPPHKIKEGKGRSTIKIKTSFLQEGENTIQIGYDSNVLQDPDKGFVLHGMGITGK
ncbi:MAG: hypothetical protein GYB31_20900 [Bacteroidetes bacterium]|nr:hypothetical protein [Bacteroidota bacterium]